MQIKRGGGFTLAELLIVMAIIVVLAAIAIPTFGKQLETARETSDAEAIRAALTDAFTKAYMDFTNDAKFTHSDGKTITFDTAPSDKGAYTFEITPQSQKTPGFEYITPKFIVGKMATAKNLDETVKFGSGSDSGVGHFVTFTFAASTESGQEAEITLDSVKVVATDPNA